MALKTTIQGSIITTFRCNANGYQTEKIVEPAEKVAACQRNCAFIVTERHDMVRRPWKPILWIPTSRRRVRKELGICW